MIDRFTDSYVHHYVLISLILNYNKKENPTNTYDWNDLYLLRRDIISWESCMGGRFLISLAVSMIPDMDKIILNLFVCNYICE